MILFVPDYLSYLLCPKPYICFSSVSNHPSCVLCLKLTVIFTLSHTKYQIQIVSDPLQWNPENGRTMIFYLSWLDISPFKVCFSRVSLYRFRRCDTGTYYGQLFDMILFVLSYLSYSLCLKLNFKCLKTWNPKLNSLFLTYKLTETKQICVRIHVNQTLHLLLKCAKSAIICNLSQTNSHIHFVSY